MSLLKACMLALALSGYGAPAEVTVHFADVGIAHPARVRDLWAGHDLGKVQEKYTATVPRHGVVMLRVEP